MFEKNLLICLIVFLALYLGWCAFVVGASMKSRPEKKKPVKFDERQIAAQGNAYKWAFWTMCCYYLLYATISGAAGIIWCDPFLGAFLGVIVGATVFALICVFRDAYFRPDQSRKSEIVVINIICVCQGIVGLMNLSDGTVIEDGVLSADALQLFILLMGLVLDVAFIIKHRQEKLEEQE